HLLVGPQAHLGAAFLVSLGGARANSRASPRRGNSDTAITTSDGTGSVGSLSTCTPLRAYSDN
ncbi:hypothetical protein PFISCL1PPCAC_1060, partial [Pristionchus fissidentatus]